MPPPTKRRKTSSTAIAEITFDPSARQEWLTGFHKRKLHRAKQAQEAAEKKARAERIEERRRLREERKAEIEKHILQVNATLYPGDEPGDPDHGNISNDNQREWTGIKEPPEVDHEAKYVDEDRYTTVTVEAIDVSMEGLYKAGKAEELVRDGEGDVGEEVDVNGKAETNGTVKAKRVWTKQKPGLPKRKRKKFRYESKAERKVTRLKEHSGNKVQAKARRSQ